MIEYTDYTPFTLFLVLVLGAAGYLLAGRAGERGERVYLGRLFLAAFAARMLFVVVLREVIPLWVQDHAYLSYGFLNDDGYLYDRLAWQGLRQARSGVSPFAGFWAAPGYVSLTMGVYALFGRSVFAICTVNAFIGALVPVFAYTVARSMLPTRGEARLAALLVAFSPDLVMYSGAHLKDISVTAALMIGMWAVLRLRSAGGGRVFGLFLVLIGCAAYLTLTRFYFVLVLAVALFLTRRRGVRLTVRDLVLRGGIVVALMVTLGVLVNSVYPLMQRWVQNPLSTAVDFYGGMVNARDEDSFYNILQPPLNLLLIPVGVVFVLLMPFIMWPFLDPDAIYRVLLPVSLVWYVLLPFSVAGLLTLNRQGFGRVVFVIVVVTLLLLAVSGSGFTTGGRTRLPIQPFLLLNAAGGLGAWRRGTPMVRSLTAGYSVLLAIGCLFYLWAR